MQKDKKPSCRFKRVGLTDQYKLSSITGATCIEYNDGNSPKILFAGDQVALHEVQKMINQGHKVAVSA